SLGGDAEGRLVYFMSIDNARFRKPVEPGDQLRLVCRKERQRGNVWKFAGEAYVNETIVAEAAYTAMIMDA
ncbi:MAG: 3-hydroxyacyl-[acyl-carrier-protein] dehydratase FabZ, partial [Rhodospirillaceae bacterium]